MELESCYLEANQEIDDAFEFTTSDGLEDLAAECDKLDAASEQALAEEGLAQDFTE